MPRPYSVTAQQAADMIKDASVSGIATAAGRFQKAAQALATVQERLRSDAAGMVEADYWSGPAADRFTDVVHALNRFLLAVEDAVDGYYSALENAANRLYQAFTALGGGRPASDNASPEMNSLAATYASATRQLEDIPTEPAKVEGGAGSAEPTTEDEGPGSEETDPEAAGEESAEGAGDEEAGAGGGMGDPSGEDPMGDDPTGEEPLGGGGGGSDPLGEDPLGGDPLGGDSLGGDPLAEDPLGGPGAEGSETEGAGDGLGGGTGAEGSGGGIGPGAVVPPLTDSNRALPGAPTATSRDGKVTGIDVDGDGRPDLGLDGKPLRGPDGELLEPDKLITTNGLTGIDVNGDGVPDIGVDGEILPGAPIVEGPDGTIGIDVDEDGIPDIGFSGQILPDAPIVSTGDVRGVDVNGDGIPDVGMDRRPLPYASLVTVDGVTGVDVNGDGVPDIGLQGEILDGAPLVTGPNGIVGVDVNGDGKPDIAATGGLRADRDVAAGTTRPVGLAPALSAAGQTVTRGLEVTDPPTTLAAAATRGPVLAASRLPVAGSDFVPMPAMFLGGMGMGLGAGLDGTAEASSWAGVPLVESDDTWVEHAPPTAVLGRDKPTTSWEESSR